MRDPRSLDHPGARRSSQNFEKAEFVNTRPRPRDVSETIAAWMVDQGLVRPGIAAHAHAWRVHYGK